MRGREKNSSTGRKHVSNYISENFFLFFFGEVGGVWFVIPAGVLFLAPQRTVQIGDMCESTTRDVFTLHNDTLTHKRC